MLQRSSSRCWTTRSGCPRSLRTSSAPSSNCIALSIACGQKSPEWYVSEATEDDLALLPRMVTDITLRHADHTIIVDAKFYRKALIQGRYGERVRSQHLYQLVTYLQNERMRQGQRSFGHADLPRRWSVTAPAISAARYPGSGSHSRPGTRLADIEVELHGLLDDCAGAASSNSIALAIRRGGGGGLPQHTHPR